MAFAKVFSAHTSNLKTEKVDVEIDISNGIYSLSIVGLGDKAVSEARDRVTSAIKNSGFKAPKQKNEKIIVSLAPAHTKKHGPLFDLAIAVGYLKASENLEFNTDKTLFIGELALDGGLRKIHGVLPIVKFAKEKKFQEIFIPAENCIEAGLVDGIRIYPAENLGDVLNHLNKNKLIAEQKKTFLKQTNKKIEIDFESIKGQRVAKRGLLIAGAGGHNISFQGPPGTGKTMLSKAFKEILPPPNEDELLEITTIYSSTGLLSSENFSQRPFRAPHHSASYSAICGGGGNLNVGEITLAHCGVLFLDEFPEFDRRVIESLRGPLEDGKISLARKNGSVTYPADFILITTMNPCPCGYYQTNIKPCDCSNQSILKYKQKVSGPILDRIDMFINVDQIVVSDLIDHKKSAVENPKTESAIYRDKIDKTRRIQIERQGFLNSKIPSSKINDFIQLDETNKNLLKQASEKLNLSARAVHKVLKLSRTIADLDESEEVKTAHLLEALQFRRTE
jgi:magnesium chelatase family protein